ncbi:hypothetical protein COOONC_21514, partial [Cooperia oncophora]
STDRSEYYGTHYNNQCYNGSFYGLYIGSLFTANLERSTIGMGKRCAIIVDNRGYTRTKKGTGSAWV